MSRFSLSLVLSIFTNFILCGQTDEITEFDIHGCWIRSFEEGYSNNETRLFRPCNFEGASSNWGNNPISFMAFNKCVFYEIPLHIDIPQKIEGTWSLDLQDSIVTIFYPQNYHKEYWERVRETEEEFKDIEIPKIWQKKRFKVIRSGNDLLEIKELKTNNKLRTTAIPH